MNKFPIFQVLLHIYAFYKLNGGQNKARRFFLSSNIIGSGCHFIEGGYMKKTLSMFLAGILLSIVLFIPSVYAQVSQYVIDVKVPEAIEKMSLPLSVQLTQNTQIQRVLLHYREFGKTEYKQADMLLSGRTASATIPAKSVIAPYIEYYISMQLANNRQATFPSENPRSNPLKIQVKELDERDMEVRFLSPEPGEMLAAEDLAVAVSLMYASDAVDTKNTRIYLDGVDVTDEAIIADDVLLYNPANFKKPLSLGSHSIKIELRDTLGKAYYTKHQEFNLSTATAIEMEKARLQYNGNAQAEFRNEKIDDKSTNYIRGDVHLGSVYKDYTFSGDVHITNEEKSYLQPQNRFSAAIQAANIAKVQVGDAYPQFPSLFVSGKRVRGITGSVTLGYFNLDVSYGKTDRAIEGTLGSLVSFPDTIAASSRLKETIFEGFGEGDTVLYRMFTAGTFGRNFFAIRPSFGSGENFQFGLTYLKSKDDQGSIRYGTYPKENVVAGADLLLAFDDQRVRWASQVAMSLENNDISSGSYSDDDIKLFKGVDDPEKTDEQKAKAREEADDLIKIAKIIRSFITVNADLSPLDPIKGMPSLAFESELSLNYFNNYVRAMLFRRGISYSSYGNDFIQNDIAGFNISDRVRFLQNKIIASISYENKWNNTQNEAGTPTTSYNTFNTYVTAYPGVNLPSFTVGYGLYTRKNPIELNIYSTQLDSILVANESTNRFFLSSNYDFHMLVRNSLSASLSIANKKDNTFYKRDQDNVNFSALIVSSFSIPLQTTFGFIINHTAAYSMPDTTVVNATTTQKFDYQTLTLGARYRLLDDWLNLLATVAPSFGDFKRLLLQAGAEYQVMENHYLVGQFDFIDNSDRASDTIFSILYRFMF